METIKKYFEEVKRLRNELIQSIHDLLTKHGLNRLGISVEDLGWEDDEIWVIMYDRYGEPSEYKVDEVFVYADGSIEISAISKEDGSINYARTNDLAMRDLENLLQIYERCRLILEKP